jgi:hypothetical protein
VLVGPENVGRKASGKETPSARLKDEKLFAKNPASLSSRFTATPSRRFKFHNRHQLLIRMHNETLSVVAIRVSNEDRSPVRIHGGDAAPTPTGFAEIVSDDSPQG